MMINRLLTSWILYLISIRSSKTSWAAWAARPYTSDEICSYSSNVYWCVPTGVYFRKFFNETESDIWWVNYKAESQFEVPGVLSGNFLIYAVLQSNLSCFYNKTCLSELNKYLNDSLYPFNSTALVIPSSFAYLPIINNLAKRSMVDLWQWNSSYQNYFVACNTSTCTYTDVYRVDVIFIITTVTSFIGGMVTVLMILMLPIVEFLRKRIKSFKLFSSLSLETLLCVTSTDQQAVTVATEEQISKGTTSNVVRITRVKSCSHGSVKTTQQNGPIKNEPIDTLSLQGIKDDIHQSQNSHSLTNKKSLDNKNSISSTMKAPGNNYDPLLSPTSSNSSSNPTTKQIPQKLKSSRFSLGDPHQLYIVGKENMIKKGYCKQCASCRPYVVIILAFVILLILGIIAAIVATILTLEKSNTTTSKYDIFANTTTTTQTTTTTATTTTTTTTVTSDYDYIDCCFNSVTSNICTSLLSGIQMISNCYPCNNYSYFQFIYNYTDIASRTVLAFSLRRETLYFGVDTVSVQDYAALGTELLVNGGFDTGNISPWVYCNQNNQSNTGGVTANNTISYNGFTYFSQSGPYFYLGGSNVSADYLTQTVPTTAGHVYRVGIWSMFPGAENLTSTNLFLGV
ncbi:hypothetical protein I4U23_022572 [Adineta vaga]|nr:hypothetical protein I4U23_022572 [Adineta vaga]